MHERIGQMTGVARESVIELERPEVGFGSRQMNDDFIGGRVPPDFEPFCNGFDPMR